MCVCRTADRSSVLWLQIKRQAGSDRMLRRGGRKRLMGACTCAFTFGVIGVLGRVPLREMRPPPPPPPGPGPPLKLGFNRQGKISLMPSLTEPVSVEKHLTVPRFWKNESTSTQIGTGTFMYRLHHVGAGRENQRCLGWRTGENTPAMISATPWCSPALTTPQSRDLNGTFLKELLFLRFILSKFGPSSFHSVKICQDPFIIIVFKCFSPLITTPDSVIFPLSL